MNLYTPKASIGKSASLDGITRMLDNATCRAASVCQDSIFHSRGVLRWYYYLRFPLEMENGNPKALHLLPSCRALRVMILLFDIKSITYYHREIKVLPVMQEVCRDRSRRYGAHRKNHR